MPRVNFQCDANDIGLKMIEEFVEFAAQKQVKCKFETRKQVKAKLESGAAKSEHDAEKQVAEETGEKFDTVRKRNQRAKKAEEKVGTKSQNVPTEKAKTPDRIDTLLGLLKRAARLAEKVKTEPTFNERLDELTRATSAIKFTLTETREGVSWLLKE
jgi:FtsZ-binding cell division protein ZapB